MSSPRSIAPELTRFADFVGVVGVINAFGPLGADVEDFVPPTRRKRGSKRRLISTPR